MNYCLGPCGHRGKMIFAMITGPHPRCPLPPHPNPPPRRGEGRVGVIRLKIFMQRLGLFPKHDVGYSFPKTGLTSLLPA